MLLMKPVERALYSSYYEPHSENGMAWARNMRLCHIQQVISNEYICPIATPCTAIS